MNKIIKKNFPLLIIFLSVNVFANEAKAKELLKLADQNTNYGEKDFKADYVIVTNKPGSGKSVSTATMYRRDSKSMFTILITGPNADKGKGYVQFDNVIWFYDPHDKQFTYTSAKNKFQNTALNNSDLIPQRLSQDYKIKNFSEVTLGKFKCIYYELTALSNNVDYPTVKLWVSKDDGLIRKKEDYSLSGQLLRTTAIPSYQLISGKQVPIGMLVEDKLKGIKIDGKVQYERTQITISNVSFQKQSNIVYSKKYLEEMSD